MDMTGPQFREAREYCGLSRAKLAFLSGVSPRTIVRLEQGAEVMPLLRKAVLAALEGAVVGGACVRPAAE